MIRYVDWLQFKRYLCFDLTRLADRLQSPTEPVQLAFLGTRDDNLPNGIGAVPPQLQVYALTERLNQVTFRFSSSDVAIVVGSQFLFRTYLLQQLIPHPNDIACIPHRRRHRSQYHDR
jgi:hypothetical protein